MTKIVIKNTPEYFEWLCDKVKHDNQEKSYYALLKTLYNKEFYWSTIELDENRAVDGKKLRDTFASEMGYTDWDSDSIPCSMFELILALAKRYDAILFDTYHKNRTSKWFWKFLNNLKLTDCYDEMYGLNSCSLGSINDILNAVIERTYKPNGEGGLFPLNKPKKDQRKVELWYQMSNYLMENHYVNGNII